MSTDSNKNQTTSLDDVLAAYAELEATGERVDHEAFIARYPDMAEELRAFFDGNELLDMLVHPTTGLEDGSNRLTEMFTGSLLGRFELRREHARGGLGKVWKAHDPLLRREVALKEIREEQAQNPIARHRFLREAQITGQLEHPNIVPVHELGRDSKDDRLFYTMRFVQGDTLREVIESHHRKYGRRAPMSCRRLLNKFVNICEAMAYAHARGVVHRDLKPQNVAIGEFGEVVVMDWGLAKIGDKDDESARTVGISSDAKGQQTVAGHAMGTPAYMAPEQAAGRSKEISSRTDVYGLGAILFEILTGSAPHRGPTTDAILQAILNRETPSARERLPTVPRQLEAICGKAMAKQGSDRYGSARDLALDIQHWLDDEPISVCPETLLRRAGRWQRRHRPLVAIALMFALLMGSCIGWLSVANRERFHDKLVQRTAQVEAIRDEVRFALMDGNVEEGLAKYGETLASPQFERSFLQGIADRSNDKNRTLANRLLDALSELAILQVRADLQKAKDVSEANEVQVAATQALELADTWGRAPTAARLFYATLVKREGDSAAELSPDDLKLATTTTLDCFLTGEVARYAGDYEQAIEHYETALAHEPTHFWAQLSIGICRFELGEPALALESFNQAVRLNPKYAWVYAARALVLADLGRWEEAHADLNKAEAIDPTFYGTPNNRGIVWYTRATTDKSASVADRMTWLEAAIEAYEMATRRNPKFANAYNNYGMAAQELARLFQREGDQSEVDRWIRKAETKFSTAMTSGSNTVTAAVNKAILAAEFSDMNEPDLTSARLDLDEADEVAKHLSGAELQAASRLIAYGRAFVEALDASGVIKDAQTKTDVVNAARVVDTVVAEFAKVVPDTSVEPIGERSSTIDDHLTRNARLARARLRYQLFELYVKLDESQVTDELMGPLGGDFDALAALNANEMNVADRAELFEMRAVVRHWLQQHNRDMVGDTLVEYSRALEADPQNASLRMQRGWLLAKTQRQALEDFEVAINAADPAESNRITRALAHSGRAYVYAMEGYEDDAIAAAEQASALAPENEDVQFNAAIAYSLCVELAKRDPAQAASAGEYTDRAVILLKKSLEMRRNRDPQWNEKWRRLLAEPGFTAIRDDEGFKALLQ